MASSPKRSVGVFNDEIYRNNSPWTRTFAFKLNGAEENLTGSTIEVDILKSYDTAEVIKTLTIGNGATIGGTGNNKIIISTTTSDIPYGSWVYIVRTIKNGIVNNRMTGRLDKVYK